MQHQSQSEEGIEARKVAIALAIILLTGMLIFGIIFTNHTLTTFFDYFKGGPGAY
jgi:ABC-type transport system involved in cytochrome c biogenesis permease subunit